MPAQTAKTPGNGSGTLSYTLASDSFDIESVYVSVDATVATGPVTAELTVRDQSGVVIARKKQATTIPAGQAGSATWALRLDDEAAAGGYATVQDEGVALAQETVLDFVGAGVTATDDAANSRTKVTIPGGSGIQFDTAPQAGNWLFVQTTGSGTPRGYGIEIDEPNGNGIIIASPFIALGDIDEASNGALFRISGGHVRLDITGGNQFELCQGYNGPRIIRAGDAGGSMVLGFYGASAVTQAAAPVTLGDVITVLQNLGLTA